MKRIWSGICLFLLSACILAGCSNYVPKQEDFELSVTPIKAEYVQGEEIEYTVTLIRKSGGYFEFQASSTLCCNFFDIAGTEPSFAQNNDTVTHRIGRNYTFEETNTIRTEHYEPGQYLLAIRFYMKQLEYSFDQEITIAAP